MSSKLLNLMLRPFKYAINKKFFLLLFVKYLFVSILENRVYKFAKSTEEAIGIIENLDSIN